MLINISFTTLLLVNLVRVACWKVKDVINMEARHGNRKEVQSVTIFRNIVAVSHKLRFIHLFIRDTIENRQRFRSCLSVVSSYYFVLNYLVSYRTILKVVKNK